MTLPDNIQKKIDELFVEIHVEDFDKATCDTVLIARDMLIEMRYVVDEMYLVWNTSRKNAIKSIERGATNASGYLTYCDVVTDVLNKIVKSIQEREMVLDKIIDIKYDSEGMGEEE